MFGNARAIGPLGDIRNTVEDLFALEQGFDVRNMAGKRPIVADVDENLGMFQTFQIFTRGDDGAIGKDMDKFNLILVHKMLDIAIELLGYKGLAAQQPQLFDAVHTVQDFIRIGQGRFVVGILGRGKILD